MQISICVKCCLLQYKLTSFPGKYSNLPREAMATRLIHVRIYYMLDINYISNRQTRKCHALSFLSLNVQALSTAWEVMPTRNEHGDQCVVTKIRDQTGLVLMLVVLD